MSTNPDLGEEYVTVPKTLAIAQKKTFRIRFRVGGGVGVRVKIRVRDTDDSGMHSHHINGIPQSSHNSLCFRDTDECKSSKLYNGAFDVAA